MKRLDYGFCVLLALGGLGHLFGTFAGYELGTEVFAWSLSASGFVFTLVFLNVMRIRRPGVRVLALGAAVPTLVWAGIALMFGGSIGAVADPRILMHVVAALGLMAMALSGSRSGGTRPISLQ